MGWRIGCTAFFNPRVATARQPWAEGHGPVGANFAKLLRFYGSGRGWAFMVQMWWVAGWARWGASDGGGLGGLDFVARSCLPRMDGDEKKKKIGQD